MRFFRVFQYATGYLIGYNIPHGPSNANLISIQPNPVLPRIELVKGLTSGEREAFSVRPDNACGKLRI
jgi:hypothetical protein